MGLCNSVEFDVHSFDIYHIDVFKEWQERQHEGQAGAGHEVRGT